MHEICAVPEDGKSGRGILCFTDKKRGVLHFSRPFDFSLTIVPADINLVME